MATTSSGKALFIERCGACHTLARAGTAGTVGPDLDAAFRRAVGLEARQRPRVSAG